MRWPNTGGAEDTEHGSSRVSSLRLFKAWDLDWPEKKRLDAWRNVVDFVRANDAKVLVGAPISCKDDEDLLAWSWTKELLQLLGPKHVMGLAIGNEMELLFTKPSVDLSAISGSSSSAEWRSLMKWASRTSA
jgi:hypothetical protein